ncbi:MAG: hypothetical protein LBR14_01405 [Clostridiales Family XIII bacterium]|nr:hypothetical protein [Clostridiales Family XIII bacterium]
MPSFEAAAEDGRGCVAAEPWDHGLTVEFVTLEVTVFRQAPGQQLNKYKPEMWEQIYISVYVTDSRVAFFCETYDVGGSGAIPGKLHYPNYIERGAYEAAGRKRTRGTVMVGHIRYEWLASVGYRGVKYALYPNVTLTYVDDRNDKWTVILTLNRKDNAAAAYIANKIAYKAARYKLAMTNHKTPEEIRLCEYYAGGGRIAQNPNTKQDSWSGDFPHFAAPLGGAYRPDPAKF